jgi:hypothetical protein
LRSSLPRYEEEKTSTYKSDHLDGQSSIENLQDLREPLSSVTVVWASCGSSGIFLLSLHDAGQRGGKDLLCGQYRR